MKQAWENLEDTTAQTEELKSALAVAEQLGIAKAAEHAMLLRTANEQLGDERLQWQKSKDEYERELAKALQQAQDDKSSKRVLQNSVESLEETIRLLEGKLLFSWNYYMF